jgi:hypothetical protein
MSQHPRAALAHEGGPRTDVVEVLVGEDYAPQVPHAHAGLDQGAADRPRLTRQPRIDQRVAILVIEDQGQVQEALGLPRTPRYGQDINTVGDSHRSPLGPYILTAAVRDITLPWLVWLAYADVSM